MAENPIALLPCPWCGSGNVGACWRDDDDGSVVQCLECLAEGPCFPQSDFDKVEQRAIAAWNKGPYADRFEIHSAALKEHADQLKAQAAEHLAKADELLKKAEAANA